MKINKEEYKKIELSIEKGDIVFLYGDLGAGKTTLTQYILNNLFDIQERIKSPTYIHYKKYKENIYHFDLYRLESYDEFVNIGGEEILDNKDNISIIEWPELIEKYYKPKYNIFIKKIEGNDEEREIEVISE